MQTLKTAKTQLKNAVSTAIKTAIDKGELINADIPDFVIETPADRKNGDFATNAAMAGARVFRTAPVKIAQAITSNIELEDTFFERCEVAGPGFINFFYSKDFYASVLKDVEEEKENYGSSDYGQGKNINVEFVSANPTGPMHMGNARGGALGDCLAAVLKKAGYNSYKEFYVNDAGNQIEKFACSLEARYLQLYKDGIEFPEDGYQGLDITDHAKAYADEFGDKLVDIDSSERKKALVDYALPKNISKMQSDMEKYKIHYDKWFFESTLHDSGKVKAVVDLLTEKGLTYEKEGAMWYLRVFIDQDEGITIADCERANAPISDILDEKDPIPQSYMLEVGSAGLERELVKEEHFEVCCGDKVKIRFIRAVDGEKEIVAQLAGADKEGVTVILDSGDEKKFPLSDIAFVKLYLDF